jgi:hypothetical protein
LLAPGDRFDGGDQNDVELVCEQPGSEPLHVGFVQLRLRSGSSSRETSNAFAMTRRLSMVRSRAAAARASTEFTADVISGRICSPNGVGATPRVERSNSLPPSWAIPLDSDGWAPAG